MKILLTGSDGFIGSHLLERLVSEGHEVTALAQYNSFGSLGWIDSSENHVRENANIVLGDVRDSLQMLKLAKGQDAILHLAALIAIPYSYQAPESYIQTNVLGTLNLLNAGLEADVEKFIHTSTSEVYGTAEFVPITEKHPLKGQSPYSASKIAADQLVYSYFTSFGMPNLTIRPFNTFGPRQSTRAVIPTVISQVAKGKTEISLGATTPTRDFTYIEDTVEGFVCALKDRSGIGLTVNLGTGFEISVADLVMEIGYLMGKELLIKTSEDRLRPKDSEVERLLSDNSLAKTILGWEPKLSGKLGLSEGLKKTISWFTDSKNLDHYRNDGYVV